MKFPKITQIIEQSFKFAPLIHPPRWQSRDVSDRPEMATYEILNHSFVLDLEGEDLRFYQELIKPNLPWADNHFTEERVSGHPINPGEQWKAWPYAASAATHKEDVFDHSYAERYWPKNAGQTPGGYVEEDLPPHRGIRFEYGDLHDLVTLLANEPLTRQAYLPVWFPEDLAAAKLNKRVPCTLGYHFIMRDQKLHVVYPMRSCDYLRHFRDDVYLTIRLLLWVLDECRKINSSWDEVQPGTLTMHITSLHIFRNDRRLLETPTRSNG